MEQHRPRDAYRVRMIKMLKELRAKPNEANVRAVITFAMRRSVIVALSWYTQRQGSFKGAPGLELDDVGAKLASFMGLAVVDGNLVGESHIVDVFILIVEDTCAYFAKRKTSEVLDRVLKHVEYEIVHTITDMTAMKSLRTASLQRCNRVG